MPVYTVEPGEAERAAAADLVVRLAAGSTADGVVPAPRRSAEVEQEKDPVLLTARTLAASL
jgi:hypothetical protein